MEWLARVIQEPTQVPTTLTLPRAPTILLTLPTPSPPQGTVQLDLQLRDGVRICQLMNKLREASIPHTDITTGSTDSKRSNIQLFLEAAQEYGLPQQYLFEVRGW